MDNLISVFMNYKVNRLVEYGVAIYQQDSQFVRDVLNVYFQTYIENYYYQIFSTLENDETFNRRNLKAELTGIMEEMVYDYKSYEDTLSKEDYQTSLKMMKELRDLAYEVVRIDTLEFTSKDELPNELNAFLQESSLLTQYLDGHTDKLVRLVRDTYNHEQKMIQFGDRYFQTEEKHFTDTEDVLWYQLKQHIQTLDVYRKGLVEKVFQDEKFEFEKFTCLVQKISHELLMNFIHHQENQTLIIELPDVFINRGKIDDRVLALIDNPMFRKNVVLAVSYNTYLNQKNAFTEDYRFACTQDFRHINDIYKKVDSIYNEGLFQFLIVLDCKEDDSEFFTKYKNDVLRVLRFEEE